MKDDTSTPTPEGSSPNEFERGMPGTQARDDAEAAIQQLRQRGGIFVEAVRATRMPMALTDPNLPGNPIVFANEAFVKLSGYRMDEVLGQQPHFMNGPGTDPNDVARFAEAIRSDQDDIIESVQYRKDGSRFVATVLISAFKDGDGRTLNHFLSYLDVTRRVEAEAEVAELKALHRALHVSEAKYRGLLNSIDEGFCIIEVLFDDAGRPIDYIFPETNSSFERQTGIEGAVGRRMREIAPDHEQHWFDIYGRIARTGEPERFEQPAEALGRYYDVYAFRVEEHAKNQVAILFNDITDRKRAEATLRESEERQAFQLRLSDAIRPLSDPVEVVTVACELLGHHLGVGRCGYGEVDETDEYFIVERDWTDGTMPSFTGKHLLVSFGPEFTAAYRAGESVRIDDALADAHAAGAEAAFEAAGGVRASLGIPLIKEGRFAAGLFVQQMEPRHWTDQDEALAREVVERTWASVQRARAEAALRESEEKYRSLFESMDEAYAVVEVLKDEAGRWADFRFIEVNPAFMEHTTMPYPVGKTATELLGTPNPRWVALYGQALDTGKPLRVEESEGTLGVIFDLNIFALDQAQNRVAVLFTNVTERKRSEEALIQSERHATLLLAELQHRVRNTLSIIRSIARRTAETTDTSEDMLAHFQGRLDAFSRVQSALTRSPDATVDLTSLIEDELVAHAAREGEQVQMEGPPVLLQPKMAERLSLAIHELATNAVKHGALLTDKGRISISWKVRQQAGGEELYLQWRESGLDLADEAVDREGFGMELLRRSLPYDVEGHTEIEFRPQGLAFEMVVPLPKEPAPGFAPARY